MRTDMLRNITLTIAGIAATTGGIAGPAVAAHTHTTPTNPANPANQASPAKQAKQATQAQTDRKPTGDRELPVRYQAQPNFYYCGPAATRNALSVQGKNIDVEAMAKQMGTTEAGTNSINDITPVLNKETGTKDAYKSVEIRQNHADDNQTNKLRTDIIHTINNNRAVVANIAGTTTDTDGTTHSFEGGHYISVVGYHDGGNTATIADSANPDQATYHITIDNLADWIATRGYTAS
jgi:Peptidase_C39 like family